MGGLRGAKYFFHICVLIMGAEMVSSIRKYDRKGIHNLREEVREMFQHAYDSYLKYAYPYDELRPLSCDGVDTWGSYSLTLIDALDTLAVMGNFSEFQRVVDIIAAKANFDANINVSVFETNIRIIGGLLSAHLLSYRAGVAVEPGWPCNGPLLRLAEDVAQRLVAAFDTATGMPYGTVNLRYGVPHGETSITCTAGVGTFIVEFGTLSRLTGDPLYEEVAMNALNALYHHQSPIGLVGNHIDVQTGRWTAQDAGIGAGVDSYYEYLVKGALLLQRPELMHMFHKGRAAIDKYLKRDDWHLWVSMTKGQVTLPVFQSLEAYWPGVLSLIGDVNKAMKTLHNYHQVWKQYGFTPEYYNIPQGEAGTNREGYPLRPELIESVMYLYRATGDPYLLEVGEDILRSIQHSAHTPCGYATIKDVRDHRKEDRMESFFLAETTKYLYLLFDPDNFIHNQGQHGRVINTPWGECVLEAGGYIFNTEAHPIDPGALHCCSGHRQDDIQAMLTSLGSGSLKGELLSSTHRLWKSTPLHKRERAAIKETPGNVLDDKIPVATKSDSERENLNPEFVKRLNYLEKLASEMGDAVDVLHLSEQEIDAMSYEPEKEALVTEETSRMVPNSSIFDNLSEDFPVEPPSEAPLPKKGESNKTKLGNSTSGSTSSLLEYRADDSDQVYYVIDGDDSVVRKESSSSSSSEQVSLSTEPSEDDLEQENMDINGAAISQLSEKNGEAERPAGPQHMTVQFDPQALLERLRKEARFSTNSTWEQDYQLLSCQAQPFLQRLAMSGEFFGVV